MAEEINEILIIVDELLDDSTIPKNVKFILSEVKNIIQDNGTDIVKLTEIMYSLQTVSEDVNLPLNAKSDVWLLQSKLEKLKELVK